MGKSLQNDTLKKGIKPEVNWFNHHFQRIFKREGRRSNHINNLEQLYSKHEGHSLKNISNLKNNSSYVYKKKSEILEITLKRLRRRKQMTLDQKNKLSILKDETLLQISNKECAFDINCPICLQAFTLPVPTMCGHTFCCKCIEDSLLHKQYCPVCRAPIRNYEMSICLSAKSLISLYFDCNKNNEERQFFYQRLKDAEEWDSKRKINTSELKQGSKLDVRDTEYIWCVGSIIKIYESQGEITELLIHYLGWNRIYDEIFDVKSPRLAPLNFYTSRKQIPRYASQQTQQNFYSYVTTGVQMEQNLTIQAVPSQNSSNERANQQFQNQQQSIDLNEQNQNNGIQTMQQLIQRLQNSNVGVLQDIVGLFQTYGLVAQNPDVVEDELQSQSSQVNEEESQVIQQRMSQSQEGV